jgi:hypothetical protein
VIAEPITSLELLYEEDETAWLEAMSQLAAEGRYADMDTPHLSEYLSDMAKRDRREVVSRLTVLMSHLLKWNYQPEGRSRSWRCTILDQRLELQEMLDSGTLERHAEAVLAKAYSNARRRASAETEQRIETFPLESPWGLEEWMGDRLEF